MDRREFVSLAARLIGGLGGFSALGSLSRADEAAAGGGLLDPAYLEKGLTAMARADGWFAAHWGAAVLAGYYLCRDNRLDDATVAAIQRQLDALIRLRGEQFAPLPEERADEALIGNVPKALRPAIEGGLRVHGHAVIFASLATKALRDAPHMARPTLVDGLCGLSREIATRTPERPHGETAAYVDTQAMIEATFVSLARFRPLLGRPSIRRPNFTHMITHTDGLANLEMMGLPDLARAGYAGHAAHIAAPVPAVDANADADAARARLEEVMSTRYWEDKRNIEQWNRVWGVPENPNGYWVASGHLFKVLYAYHRLIRRVKDAEQVRLCSMILLERYMNPSVQGG